MIDVTVGNDHGPQAWVSRSDQSVDRRQKRWIAVFSVERFSEIQQYARAIAGKLDASAADLVGATMNAGSKCIGFASRIEVCRC